MESKPKMLCTLRHKFSIKFPVLLTAFLLLLPLLLTVTDARVSAVVSGPAAAAAAVAAAVAAGEDSINDGSSNSRSINSSTSTSDSDSEPVMTVSGEFMDALAKTQRVLQQDEAFSTTNTEETNQSTTIQVVLDDTTAVEGGRNTNLVIVAPTDESAVPATDVPTSVPTNIPTVTPNVDETLEAEIMAETLREETTTSTSTTTSSTSSSTTTTASQTNSNTAVDADADADAAAREDTSTVADLTRLTLAPTVEPTPASEAPTVFPWEPWMDSGVRTNFDYGVPFNFSYIFFIGGVCEGRAPDNWYSQFVDAGKKTINVTDTICDDSPNGANVYTREYHVQALKTIEERVGNKLNETLVITVAVGLESDWTPVADLLKKGMAFFHAKEDPVNFDLAEFGLVPEETLYFYFRWDEAAVAALAGQELCRIRKGATSLKIAQIWTGGRNGSLNYRTIMALEAFKAACEDTKVQEIWGMYSNESEKYRTMLLFNPLPDVILCSQDLFAAEILKIAKENLPPNQYNRIATTGWNNNGELRHLVEQRKILTTVDQVVHYPNQGVWAIIKTVLDLVQDQGLNSTKTIQNELNLGKSTTILADTLLISSDTAGYLISNLLEGYDPDAPPAKEVKVSTGLFDTTITDMNPFEGKFEAVIWVKLTWTDIRLTWNPFVFEGTVSLDPERIWTPKLYLKNQYSREDLYASPAVVASNGQVILEINIFAEFLCDTSAGIVSFPFDTYTCSIDLGAPGGVSLDQELGFSVIGSDPHFNSETSYYVDRTEDYGSHGESPERGNVAVFEIFFDRKLFTAWVRLILPAVLINMIGFISFWIPSVQESVALGVTSFLCALAFRETVEMPDTADVTWSEVFIMVNVTYQASVLLIIWVSYSGGGRWAKKIDKSLRKYHPVHLFKTAKKSERTQQLANTFSKNFKMSGATNIGYNEQGIPDNDFVGNVHFPSSNPIVVPGTPIENGLSERAPLPPADEDVSIELPPAEDKEDANNRSFGFLGINFGSAARRLGGSFATTKSYVEEKNVDWIGRWFIVPSYLIVLISLLVGGWGYF